MSIDSIKGIFSFPNPINEVSARLVASGVIVMILLTITLHQPWILLLIAYGFVARVLAGPRFSPLAQLVTRIIVPRLPIPPKYTAGPPKRFAQFIGAVFSITAVVLAFGFGLTTAAFIVIGVLGVFCALEAVLAFCAGCKIFNVLMALGLVPQETCAQCANIWTHPNLQAHAPKVQDIATEE